MLSKRAGEARPSPTLAIDAKAKALQASGVDIINLGVGEPDFDTPAHVREAAIKAINDGFTRYTPAGGIVPLKEAVADKLKADNGLSYTPAEVVVSCGAKHSLYNIAQALYGAGDEVLIPAPYWVSYPDQVMLNDAKPVFVPTTDDDGFMLRPGALEPFITKATKALILNSPSNPTGGVYNRKALEAVAETALRHNLFIISDEIYEKLVYGGAEHISIASLSPEVKARTLVVNGLSKSHAMTGWRIGYAAGPKYIIDAMTNIQSQSTSNPNSIAQKAAIAALRGPQDFITMMHAEFDARRKYMVDALNRIPGFDCRPPAGAFYAFPRIEALFGKKAGDREISSSSDLALYLLEVGQVALVAGSAFGDDRFIRLSYATSMKNLEKAVARIGDAVSRLV